MEGSKEETNPPPLPTFHSKLRTGGLCVHA